MPIASQAKVLPIFDAKSIRIPVQVYVLLFKVTQKLLFTALMQLELLQCLLCCVGILYAVGLELDVRVVLDVKAIWGHDSKGKVETIVKLLRRK